MTSAERTDIVVIGSGFGGAITAYHLAAGGAKAGPQALFLVPGGGSTPARSSLDQCRRYCRILS